MIRFALQERRLPGILWLMVVLTAVGCATHRDSPVHNESLRRELLAMEAADQKARKFFEHLDSHIADPNGTSELNRQTAAMNELDQDHTRRMKAIIAHHGWPGKSLVGKDGASAAWLLVHHATHDVPFMEHCLSLMEEAVKRGEASAREWTLLTDRVRGKQGRPQLYGSSFTISGEGRLTVDPIEDVAHLDARRKNVGLPPFVVYERQLRKTYGLPAALPLKPREP